MLRAKAALLLLSSLVGAITGTGGVLRVRTRPINVLKMQDFMKLEEEAKGRIMEYGVCIMIES